LFVAPHRLGDSLFATPGIRALRQTKPAAQIDVVALSPLSFELFENNTCVNQTYHADDYPIEKLANNYDIILPLQNINKTQDYVNHSPQVLMLPRYTGAFHYSENFYRFILQQLPEASQIPLSPYELNFTAEDRAFSDALLKSIPPTPKPFILAIHMGCHRVAKEGQRFLYKLFPFLATKDSRSWSFKRFNQLIQKLLKQHPNLYVVLTGSPSERFAADSLRPNARILNLMGDVNIKQLAALLQRCQLLLTGDTGPMHVACVVDTPIVLLCGETDPAHTGPYPRKDHHTIIQKNGMGDISVEEVYRAILKYYSA
jgi:ADP-heptose:LPS heptosyltransferase